MDPITTKVYLAHREYSMTVDKLSLTQYNNRFGDECLDSVFRELSDQWKLDKFKSQIKQYSKLPNTVEMLIWIANRVENE